MLSRNQKIQIIDAVCDSEGNHCDLNCIVRAVDEKSFCKDTSLYTDEEINHALWEIFKACGITYQPQEREHFMVLLEVTNTTQADKFTDALNDYTRAGFKIESCGVNSTTPASAWAIVSRPKV